MAPLRRINIDDRVQIVTLPTMLLSTPVILEQYFPKEICEMCMYVSLVAPTPPFPLWRNELHLQRCSLDGLCCFDD